MELFTILGGLFAFSFLTGQCFGVELSQAVWKQIVGDKIVIDDLKNIDHQAYVCLREQYTEDCLESDKAVLNYFSKTRQ